MENTPEGTSRNEARTSPVHCWDTQAHKIMCGAAGQIGSTKHTRDVTCGECLELLGRPPREAVPAGDR